MLRFFRRVRFKLLHIYRTEKPDIIKLFEKNFADLKGDWVRMEWSLAQEVLLPFYADHIRYQPEAYRRATPNDFEALKKNDKFLNVLGIRISVLLFGIEELERSLNRIDVVVSQIDLELEKRGF